MLHLNCVQATRLMSESQERELSMHERTVLHMHTWICHGCRTFSGQVGFLRQAMKGFAAHEGGAWPDAAPGEGDQGGEPPGGAV
jgi:hypothetical protein